MTQAGIFARFSSSSSYTSMDILRNMFHDVALFLLYIYMMALYWFLLVIEKEAMLGMSQNICYEKRALALIGEEPLP